MGVKVERLAGLLEVWLTGWFAMWLVDCHVGWMVGSLVGWQTCFMAGWLIYLSVGVWLAVGSVVLVFGCLVFFLTGD